MAKRDRADTQTFQLLEEDAYHAFLEWPLFLLARINRLKEQIAAAKANLDENPEKKGK